MDALNLDFTKYIPDITDAIVQVYGEKHRRYIENKINSIEYIIYNNSSGISHYYKFIVNCKRRELLYKFLSEIGHIAIDHDNINYADSLSEENEKIIEHYLGKSKWCFNPEYANYPDGIKSFNDLYNNFPDDLIQISQLSFLNFYRNNPNDVLIPENLDEFKKSDEYYKISCDVKKYMVVYNKLCLEYEEYLNEIKIYKNYVENRRIRYYSILSSKSNELLQYIEENLPDTLKKRIDEIIMRDNIPVNIILGGDTINNKLLIEYFSKEDEEKLNDPFYPDVEKAWIYRYRLKFFKNLGIGVDIDKEVSNYNEFVNKNVMSELIPQFNFVRQISFVKEAKLEEVYNDFICTNQLFLNDTNNQRSYHRIVKDRLTCVAISSKSIIEAIPKLFFTINNSNVGIVDFIFLHEVIHAIEANLDSKLRKITGFDYLNNYNIIKEKYGRFVRIYERMNETCVDILAKIVRDNLHKKGIYIADKKEHIIHNVENVNTSNILKELLLPIIQKYFHQIIEARLYGNPQIFYNLIGKDNFESINDIINKVDSLVDDGLIDENKKNENSHLVDLYNKQLNLLMEIYDKIGVEYKFDFITTKTK